MAEKAIKVTPEVWQQIEKKLVYIGDHVELRCDGYKLDIRLLPSGSYKNVLIVYVNGEVKGKWLFESCEEQRRFLRTRTKNVYTAKQLEARKKIYTKRELKAMAAEKITYYDYIWTSFKPLKNHLIKHNEVIEWIVNDREVSSYEEA